MLNKVDTYKTIFKTYEGFYKEKGSKFFSYAIPCKNENEAKQYLEKLRKENPNACHVCFAWRLGANALKYKERFSDDGEPSNSAGKPIFGQIVNFDVTNILVVVVRYYGGTNLGVGGLINAYKTAAKETLRKADIKTLTVCNFYKIEFDQSVTSKAYEMIRKFKLDIINTSYNYIEFKVKQSQSDNTVKEFERLPWFKITYLKTE